MRSAILVFAICILSVGVNAKDYIFNKNGYDLNITYPDRQCLLNPLDPLPMSFGGANLSGENVFERLMLFDQDIILIYFNCELLNVDNTVNDLKRYLSDGLFVSAVAYTDIDEPQLTGTLKKVIDAYGLDPVQGILPSLNSFFQRVLSHNLARLVTEDDGVISLSMAVPMLNGGEYPIEVSYFYIGDLLVQLATVSYNVLPVDPKSQGRAYLDLHSISLQRVKLIQSANIYSVD